LLTVGEHLIPDFDPRLVRIGTPWGGGIGYGGLLCGSVSGAMVIIGALRGRTSLDESDRPAMRLAREFSRRFEERFGTLMCEELTSGKFHRAGHSQCRETVRFAAATLLEMLDAGPEDA